ncbi:FlgB family protein [Maribius pontilimi]|uniref:FlgB family protein n=1 Tax=Palleronia pontilimi TaxID=1964209 RepID=A0A934MHB5_9RHOB|nr:FlgB family protein [Palleronia pontilimi]MBJ3763174.1 FlgB family protein [Palleronia pontilimi]
MDNIGLMRMVHDAARHAADRQEHIARNIANADTPGYRATDLPDFGELVSAPPSAMKATRPTHLSVDDDPTAGASFERPFESAPNGNSVSLEYETMQATGVQAQHDMAISIYTSAREILRTSMGRK